MDTAIKALLQHSGVWRLGHAPAAAGREFLPSGFQALDDILPAGGWPLGALVEIVPLDAGVGELSLLVPALMQCLAAGRGALLVDPPFIPYAPALAHAGLDLSKLLVIYPNGGDEVLWAVEQALRSGACGAVMAWTDHDDNRSLRRLQLAAETGRALGVVYRSGAQHKPSPCALKLSLEAAGGKMRLRILKCRGGTPGRTLLLDAYACGLGPDANGLGHSGGVSSAFGACRGTGINPPAQWMGPLRRSRAV